MKKRILIILLSLMNILILLPSCSSNKVIDIKSLNGEIVMISPKVMQGSENEGGILIINPKSGKQENILKENYYDSPVFNKDRTGILTVSNKHTQIIEFNIKNENVLDVYNDKNNTISDAKYIPNQDAISFIKDLKLYYFNLQTKTEKYIINLIGNYCWSKDGKSVLYSMVLQNETTVHKYNVDTGKTEALFKGSYPVYSSTDKYIAYLKSGQRNILIVREISSGNEWEYKTSGVYFFAFSPDDNYIAIERESKKNMKDQEMIVWDFKNNALGTLVEKISNGRTGSFDWK